MSTTAEIKSYKLSNGMTVLVQPMPWLRTAAFSISLRGGLQPESDDRRGLSGLVCEMVQRGAGPHSSRDLVAIQDNLGMDRSSGVTAAMVTFGSSMPAESLDEAIRLYAQILREPTLPQDQLEDARMMALQELRAMLDEPTHRVMRRVRELHYGERLGRSVHGNENGIAAVTNEDIQGFYQANYHAGGSIFAVAGNVDYEKICKWAEESFGDWKSGAAGQLDAANGVPRYEHIESPSAQTHIGFSFDSIPYGHPEYFKMRAAVGILSDGMSSRLFDRVREQRGLCYTVSASCNSLKDSAGVFGYAGTTPERAQETLDVTLHEIAHLADEIQTSELERWKVRIQSGLIMEQESSASRASSLASDLFQIGRVMTMDELESAIESLTVDEVRDYWLAHPPANHRIVTLGPNELTVAA